MARKLLIRTPVTRDGITLVYDENRLPVYKESIVEPWARKQFESLNSSMPEHLRHELRDIEIESARERKFSIPENDMLGPQPGMRQSGKRGGRDLI